MFYDNLKFICEQKGLKITPIVLECGGTKGVIGGWKKGAAPNSDIVMKLAVRLNVPTDLLLFGREIHSPSENLSKNEQEMLDVFSKFNDREQIKLIGRLEELYRQKQIKEDQHSVQKAYIAARSYDNHAPETVVGDFSEIFNAPDATDKYK